MKPGAHFVLRAAARLYTPVIALFALSLFVSRPAGSGVGVLVGLCLALALILHALVFGAAATRKAIPGQGARALAACGLFGAIAGVGLPGLPFAQRVVEAALALLVFGVAALAIVALCGRAPTMRHEAL